MTHAFSRLLAFPFAIVLIIAFSLGSFDFNGPWTIVVMICLICLMLIYIFNQQLDVWWWHRHPPRLAAPLRSWLLTYSPYYQDLDIEMRESFDRRLSVFMHVKNFTLKAERDYQLEEDVKAIIAHEYIRLTIHQENYLFDEIEHFVVYNHPFGTPNHQYLHTIEVSHEDGVVILSKEQLVNGFLDSSNFVNVALLSAVMVYIRKYPRLSYPEVTRLDPEEIAQSHDLDLSVIQAALGEARLNHLDLLIFCYFLRPEYTETYDFERYQTLQAIFGKKMIEIFA